MKIKTLFASIALALSVSACGSDDPTGPVDPGPPPALPAGAQIITTGTGLQYADFTVGTGAAAANGNRVRVHYTGWLAATNKFFDTSSGGAPLEFILGSQGILSGFQQGIVGMQPGGKRRLIIPPALGYGSQAVTDQRTGEVIIPANSTLIFDITLVTVSPN